MVHFRVDDRVGPLKWEVTNCDVRRVLLAQVLAELNTRRDRVAVGEPPLSEEPGEDAARHDREWRARGDRGVDDRLGDLC